VRFLEAQQHVTINATLVHLSGARAGLTLSCNHIHPSLLAIFISKMKLVKNIKRKSFMALLMLIVFLFLPLAGSSQ
jgi:hypothetical protein